MRVIGYARVSTDNQKKRDAIEIQEMELKKYTEKNGHELMVIFKDNGVSGAKDLEDRPGLIELFDYMECKDNGVEGVVIFKLDRLARDIGLQEYLIRQINKNDVRLISVHDKDIDNDPQRKLIRVILGAISDYDRSMIEMRMRMGRIHKAKKGKYAGGGVPIGYLASEKELNINDNEAETVKLIFKLKRHKRMSLREIANILAESGYQTARGGLWHASTVKYILGNPIYRGKYSYSDNIVKRADLALI